MDEGKAGTLRPGFNLHESAFNFRFFAWLVAILLVGAAAIAISPVRAMAVVRSSVVVDAATGRVLEAENADEQTYPASLTKLMTLYLAFDAIDHGKLRLDQRLRVSAHAAEQSPTKLGLRPGSTISARSAILGIVTRSANDAAVVLGEALGGDEANFAEMMNAQARRLGMTRTEFQNASGLPNPEQKTTARDMAKLAIALIHTFPQYYRFFSVRSFQFHGQLVRGHDHLLANYPGCDGLKTGFIHASGYNLVSSAVRDGHRVVGVVMGGPTYAKRDREMEHLLNVAFAKEMDGAAVPLRVANGQTDGTYRAAKEASRTSDPREVARLTSEPARHVSGAPHRREVLVRASRDFSVRIGGVFRSIRYARRVLRRAIHTAPRELNGARFEVLRQRRHRRSSYIIRVLDLSGWRAQRACRKLRSRRFRCEVLEPARSVADSAAG